MRPPQPKNLYKFLPGFTLIEVVVVMAIIAVVAAIGTPSFTTFIANSKIESKANELYGLLKQTRQNAIVTNNSSFVCRTTRAVNDVDSANARCRTGGTDRRDWSIELMSYTALSDTDVPDPNGTYGNLKIQQLDNDEERRKQMLQTVREAAADTLTIVSSVNNNVVAFNSRGALINDAPFRFAICDDRGTPELYGKIIEINQAGQIRLYRTLLTEANTDKDCTPTNN